ncbi:hypothetical protein SmJEL517_g03264 [Synchytrium microbalum]|uniref:Rap-GAP domain-containing protein n=1 Tax=Synchytrium microbalum TaxID=1806994 RepID=A0A507C4I9_9FUNG|nr:uncharacterized protein SmJEL517_g03264 [Synchytrium microbalum]TPX34019.1 hypothetical protein SmJEL517_g03264 [Synchytrium microbalum]
MPKESMTLSKATGKSPGRPLTILTEPTTSSSSATGPLSPSRSAPSPMGSVVSQKIQALALLNPEPIPAPAPLVGKQNNPSYERDLNSRQSIGKIDMVEELDETDQEMTPTAENMQYGNRFMVDKDVTLPRSKASSSHVLDLDDVAVASSAPAVPPKGKSTETLISSTPPVTSLGPSPVLASSKPSLRPSREALNKSSSMTSFTSADDGQEISNLAKLNNRALWHISCAELGPVSLNRNESERELSVSTKPSDSESGPDATVTGSLSSTTKHSPSDIQPRNPLSDANQIKTIREKVHLLFEEFLTRCDNLITMYESMSSNLTIKLHSADLIGAVFAQLLTALHSILNCVAPIVDTAGFSAAMRELTRLEAAVGIEMEQIKVNLNFPMGCLNAIKTTLAKTKQQIELLLMAYDDVEPRLLVKVVENSNVEARPPPEPLITYFGYSLEQIDDEAEYFRKYFFEQEHKTFVGIVEKIGPAIMSVKQEIVQPGDVQIFRAIMRSKTLPDTRLIIPLADIPQSTIIRHKGATKAVLSMLHPHIQPGKLRRVNFDSLYRKLLALDELQLIMRYKFGVLYCREGQRTEEEMYNNETGSDTFNEFLSILGDRVELKGFSGFAAGLDTKNEQTGAETINTKWRQYEVTYHVSTLLPFFKTDKQQIQRKRHIGNDIVTVVFLDGDAQFNPATIRSQFLHVFIVVKPEWTEDGRKAYKINITTNSEVPAFGPSLPVDAVFVDRMEFREFLLAKMINGENAAYKAPRFSKPHYRTRHMMIDDILADFGNSPQMPRETREQAADRSSTSSTSAPPSAVEPSEGHEKSLSSTGNGGTTRKKAGAYFGTFPQFQRRTSGSGQTVSATTSATREETSDSTESAVATPADDDKTSELPYSPLVGSASNGLTLLPPGSVSNSAAPSPRLGSSHPMLSFSQPVSQGSATGSDSLTRSESEEGIEAVDDPKLARRSLLLTIKNGMSSTRGSNSRVDGNDSVSGRKKSADMLDRDVIPTVAGSIGSFLNLNISSGSIRNNKKVHPTSYPSTTRLNSQDNMPTPPQPSPLGNVFQKSLDWIAATDQNEVQGPPSFFKTRGGVSTKPAEKNTLSNTLSRSFSKNSIHNKSAGTIPRNADRGDVEQGKTGVSRSRMTLGSADYDEELSDVSDYEFYSNPVSEDEYDEEEDDARVEHTDDAHVKQQGGWFADGQQPQDSHSPHGDKHITMPGSKPDATMKRRHKNTGKQKIPRALYNPEVRKQLAKMKPHRPYFMITVSLIQVGMLVYSYIVNNMRTGSLIESISVNPMIGPTSWVQIQLGARFVPCMKDIHYLNASLYQCPPGVELNATQSLAAVPVCTLSQLCGLGGFQTGAPDQWYRFIVPIFLHGGVVHLLLNFGFQLRTGIQMERDFGWWRVGMIYMISGVCGFIFGAAYSPTTPSVGCSGALYGLIACLLLDLLQNWKLIVNPWIELLKMLVTIIISLSIGLFPYLDNFAHVGGFFSGILAGLIFMPTIHFGKWDKIRKRLMMLISIPATGVVMWLMLRSFYAGSSNDCSFCKYFNCIPGMPWCASKWGES